MTLGEVSDGRPPAPGRGHGRLTAGLLALLSAACTSLEPPPPVVPSVPMPAQWSAPNPDQGPVPAQWWRGFNDPVLDRFIGLALRDNASLGAAAMRLRQARLRAESAPRKGDWSGSADAGLSLDHALGGGSGSANWSWSVSAAYELDLWGKLSAARSAAEFEAAATVYDQRALALSLVAEVAKQHWDMALVNEQLSLLATEIADTGWALTIARVRFNVGALTAGDVAQVERSLNSLRLQELQLAHQRAQSRQSLALLLGTWPELPVGELPQIPRGALPPLGAGLPAELVSRRPDVKAAETRLRALMAGVDEAQAALYPAISLTTSLGVATDTLWRLLHEPLLTLGAGLSQPLFNNARLQRGVALANARAEESAINFRQTLMAALAEVETTLNERALRSAEAEYLAREAMLSERAERDARARFDSGKTTALPWLDERQRLRSAQLALAQGRRQQLGVHMKLYQVLGGDVVVDAPARVGAPAALPLRQPADGGAKAQPSPAVDPAANPAAAAAPASAPAALPPASGASR